MKEKTIIANYGASGSGKSTCIKAIFKRIKEKYDIEILEEKDDAMDDDIRRLFKCGESLVGIESQGDPNSRIYGSLKMFEEKECDIIICACRTKGDTYQAVCNMSDKGYRIIWAQNLLESGRNGEGSAELQKILNEAYVNSILEVFDKLIQKA